MALRISVALTAITNPIIVSLIVEDLFLENDNQQLTLTEPSFKLNSIRKRSGDR